MQILAVAAAAAVAALVKFRAGSLLPSLGELGHPRAGWLAVAVAAELASLAAYALVVRELLRAGDVVARVSHLLRTTVAGIAMSASLPGGQVASAAYWYRRLRHEGASRGLSAYAMVGSMVAGVVSLAALFVAGVAAAGGAGPVASARTPILAGCAALVVIVVAVRSRAVRAGTALVRRLAPEVPDRYAVGPSRAALVGALAVGNWVLDCACLAAALAAVHADVSLRSILLAYTLSQLVGALPVLPGGGGTVEASLILTFAAFGQTSASVVAGVLLFRLISCWGLVPVGWAAVILEGRALVPLGGRRRAVPSSALAG